MLVHEKAWYEKANGVFDVLGAVELRTVWTFWIFVLKLGGRNTDAISFRSDKGRINQPNDLHRWDMRGLLAPKSGLGKAHIKIVS